MVFMGFYCDRLKLTMKLVMAIRDSTSHIRGALRNQEEASLESDQLKMKPQRAGPIAFIIDPTVWEMPLTLPSMRLSGHASTSYVG